MHDASKFLFVNGTTIIFITVAEQLLHVLYLLFTKWLKKKKKKKKLILDDVTLQIDILQKLWIK